MKVIDLSIFESELRELNDCSLFESMDQVIPKVSSMNLLEAAKFLSQEEPEFLDNMIDRCHSRCNEDNEHEVEQLKRKISTIIQDAKNFIWFQGVF